MPIAKPIFDLSEEYHQLALGLDLPEVELEGVSPEEARIRSEAGRSALIALKSTSEQPDWFERFEMLTRGGWPWRQACYIAWASMPKEGRKPASQDRLATQFLNLTSDRAISTWRKKNPAIDSMVAILQSAELWEHRADSFKNLINGMKKAGMDYKFFNHLKLFLEMTGDYVPLAQLAAVIKRKASGGAHEVDEEILEELAVGVEELANLIPSPTPGPSPFANTANGEGGEEAGDDAAD
jgi:hypothetical protein